VTHEPVPDEYLAAMLRLGVQLGQIRSEDADALLAPPGESTVNQHEPAEQYPTVSEQP
jgi:hypothetical protein